MRETFNRHIENTPIPVTTPKTAILDHSTPKKLISDILVQTLETLGFKMAFGIPGGPITAIFNSLSRSKIIQTILTQHETGAAYMALGRTLISQGSEMGLCFATSGPGITNLITGVAAAFEERVPVFVITGNVATTLKGRGAAQDSYESGIDAVKMLSPITAKSMTLMDAEQLVPTILELHALALRTKKPVHLNIPVDISFQPASPEMTGASLPTTPLAAAFLSTPEDQLRAAARDFLCAERPLIFAGHGIKTSGLEPLLREAVESLKLPIIVTSHAKGIIPEEHPLYFGTFGFAAPKRSTEFIDAYSPDAIVYLGTRLTEPSSAGWSPLLGKPEIRVHVDMDQSQLNRIYPITHPIHADLGMFLMILMEECAKLRDEGHLSPSPRVGAMKAHQQVFSQTLTVPAEHAGPANPVALIQVLDFWLPDNVVLFSDIGNTMAWVIHHLHIHEGQSFYLPLGFGSMGSGLCGAIGAKSAMPDRPVICLTGDCTALMHGTELFTALNAGLGIKIIVLNDGGHGMVDHGNRIIGFPDGNVRFAKPVDFKAFAESLGVKAYSAASLGDFLKLPLDEILSSPEAALIDIRVDRSVVPPIQSRSRVLGQADKKTN